MAEDDILFTIQINGKLFKLSSMGGLTTKNISPLRGGKTKCFFLEGHHQQKVEKIKFLRYGVHLDFWGKGKKPQQGGGSIAPPPMRIGLKSWISYNNKNAIDIISTGWPRSYRYRTRLRHYLQFTPNWLVHKIKTWHPTSISVNK